MLSYAMAPHNSRTISQSNTGLISNSIMSSMETMDTAPPTYCSEANVNHKWKTSTVSKFVLDGSVKFTKPKAKTKKTMVTSKLKSRSEGEGRIQTVDIYWKNGIVPNINLIKQNTDREVEPEEFKEERKAQVGKVLEAKGSKRKSRPLSIHQIRDKISNLDNKLHIDPLITMTHRFRKYQNELVNLDTIGFGPNHSGPLDVIQEGEAYAKIRGWYNNHEQGLFNESQFLITSRQAAFAFGGAGENENDEISRRSESEACHSKTVSKTELQRKHDDELYHFNQVKITTKPKNSGTKRKSLTQTKFVSTKEFFRGTVFGHMFS